jgi:hypothetical protein
MARAMIGSRVAAYPWEVLQWWTMQLPMALLNDLDHPRLDWAQGPRYKFIKPSSD